MEHVVVAGHVDEDARRARVELGDGVVAEHPVVAPERFDEGAVALGGEPDGPSAPALRDEPGQRDRRLARCGGDQHLLVAEARVRDEVVREERGHEEAAHEHQRVLVVGLVESVRAARAVGVVRGRDALAMGGPVVDRALAGRASARSRGSAPSGRSRSNAFRRPRPHASTPRRRRSPWRGSAPSLRERGRSASSRAHPPSARRRCCSPSARSDRPETAPGRRRARAPASRRNAAGSSRPCSAGSSSAGAGRSRS